MGINWIVSFRSHHASVSLLRKTNNCFKLEVQIKKSKTGFTFKHSLTTQSHSHTQCFV